MFSVAKAKANSVCSQQANEDKLNKLNIGLEAGTRVSQAHLRGPTAPSRPAPAPGRCCGPGPTPVARGGLRLERECSASETRRSQTVSGSRRRCRRRWNHCLPRCSLRDKRAQMLLGGMLTAKLVSIILAHETTEKVSVSVSTVTSKRLASLVSMFFNEDCSWFSYNY